MGKCWWEVSGGVAAPRTPSVVTGRGRKLIDNQLLKSSVWFETHRGALRRSSTATQIWEGAGPQQNLFIYLFFKGGAASLGLLPGLLPDLWVCFRLDPAPPGPRVRLGPGQLRDVKDDADAQVELPQNGSQLGDQVELHDLTQERVVPGCVGLELKRGGKMRRRKK